MGTYMADYPPQLVPVQQRAPYGRPCLAWRWCASNSVLLKVVDEIFWASVIHQETGTDFHPVTFLFCDVEDSLTTFIFMNDILFGSFVGQTKPPTRRGVCQF